MKTIGIFIICFCFYSSYAQDSLLISKKWQSYFADYTKEQYVTLENDDINKKFNAVQYYNCLVVFKDSTMSPMELQVHFTSIEGLCDPKETIEGREYKIPVNRHVIHKKDLKFFVFHDIPFVTDNILRKKYKIELKPDYWSAVLIDGAVRYTKYYNRTVMASGTVIAVGVGRIQKLDDDIGSDINIMGGFSFKKFAARTFADDVALTKKILAEQDGYHKSKDGLRVVMEYNNWLLKNDPTTFKSKMMFGYLIKGDL